MLIRNNIAHASCYILYSSVWLLQVRELESLRKADKKQVRMLAKAALQREKQAKQAKEEAALALKNQAEAEAELAKKKRADIVNARQSPEGQRIQVPAFNVAKAALCPESGSRLFALPVEGLANTAAVWDADSGECTHEFPGHRNKVLVVAWSHDGSIVATGSQDECTRLWDLATRAVVQELNGGQGGVIGISWPHSPSFGASVESRRGVGMHGVCECSQDSTSGRWFCGVGCVKWRSNVATACGGVEVAMARGRSMDQ